MQLKITDEQLEKAADWWANNLDYDHKKRELEYLRGLDSRNKLIPNCPAALFKEKLEKDPEATGLENPRQLQPKFKDQLLSELRNHRNHFPDHNSIGLAVGGTRSTTIEVHSILKSVMDTLNLPYDMLPFGRMNIWNDGRIIVNGKDITTPDLSALKVPGPR